MNRLADDEAIRRARVWVDTLDGGMLVYRSESRTFTLPRSRLLHWLKRRFEDRYLKIYRPRSCSEHP